MQVAPDKPVWLHLRSISLHEIVTWHRGGAGSECSRGEKKTWDMIIMEQKKKAPHGIWKTICALNGENIVYVCVVSSWFSCSLIDQQHGAQWAESKWELNRLHQGFVALCLGIEVLSSQGGMKSGAFTDSPLFYSGQLIGCFFFFLYLSIFVLLCSCPLFCYVVQGSCMQMKAPCFFFFQGQFKVSEYHSLCVCVCVQYSELFQDS